MEAAESPPGAGLTAPVSGTLAINVFGSITKGASE